MTKENHPMEKIHIVIICLTVLAIFGVVLVSCSKHGDGQTSITQETNQDTGDSTAETSQPEPSFEELPLNDPLTLNSGDSSITLQAVESALFIRSLTTAQGVNVASDSSEYSLPYMIERDGKNYAAKWQISSVAKKTYGTEKCEALFTYADQSGSEALLTICVTAHTGITGPFEFAAGMENTKAEDIRIKPGDFASVYYNVGDDAYVMAVKKESGQAEGYTHFDGQHFSGSGIYKYDVNTSLQTSVWCNTNQDWNGSGYIPMVYMQGKQAGAYCALEWSSGAVFVQGYRDGTARMSVNMDGIAVAADSKIFSTIIRGKETFLFPTVYFGAYDGEEIDDGSNLFKKWFFAIKVPDNLRENPNEPFSQMDMQAGLDAADMNVDAIKWDYGWWSNDARGSVGNWTSYEGSWKVRNKGYLSVMEGYSCVTLKGFTTKAKNMGVSLTLYVLLHDTLDSSGKVTDREGEFNSLSHPDWFSDRRIDSGMGNSADLGNEECVAYLQQAMKKFFSNNGVTTWRSDFEPISRSSNLKNRHDANGSDVQYWCTVGFKELAEYLIDNVKDFRYESCSSGGSMKDLFTATLATVINCDDAANYLSMRATFYDSSYVIHPSQLQMPCNTDFFNPSKDSFYPAVKSTCTDEDYDFKDAMLDMGFRTQLLGSPMFSSWTGTVMRDYITEYATMYEEKVRPLVREGDLYHILPRPDGVNWDGVMYSDADSSNEIKGAVFLFKPSEKASDTCTVKLDGLNGETMYKLSFEDREEQNCVVKGSELMETGITVSIKSIGSEIIWITEDR